MRILFVNPNITQEITDTMAAEATRAASPGTLISPVTASFGALYIENRVEAAIASHAVLDVLSRYGSSTDAVIISAFGDPGVAAAKELMGVPVIGVSEAAFHFAYICGRRYGIVCLTPRLRTWYIECAEEHGFLGRLVSARALTTPVPNILSAKEDLADALLEECLAAVSEDNAEVVIIGGGPLAGVARQLAGAVPVPLLDGISCAVRLAEALVGLSLRQPREGSFARPAPKPTRGLSPALSMLIERGAPHDKMVQK